MWMMLAALSGLNSALWAAEPGRLSALMASQREGGVELTWTADERSRQPRRFVVERDGERLGETESESFIDRDPPLGRREYRVRPAAGGRGRAVRVTISPPCARPPELRLRSAADSEATLDGDLVAVRLWGESIEPPGCPTRRAGFRVSGAEEVSGPIELVDGRFSLSVSVPARPGQRLSLEAWAENAAGRGVAGLQMDPPPSRSTAAPFSPQHGAWRHWP